MLDYMQGFFKVEYPPSLRITLNLFENEIFACTLTPLTSRRLRDVFRDLA